MAKRKHKSAMHATDDGTRAESPAAYFLSLSLENVRCFGPQQTLDLSDGNGRPARWTVILGFNGTGKTTILQSLVEFELVPLPDPAGETGNERHRFVARPFAELESMQRGEKQQAALIQVEIAASKSLLATPSQIGRYQLTVNPKGKLFKSRLDQVGGAPVDLRLCYAYGAGRRMGAASLSDAGSDDPTASLFSDKADLRNPEEWLLRLDYAATKAPHIQNKRRARFDQVKDLLLSILHEVEDIRLVTPEGPNPTPRAEFKTPYGWVPLRNLGYGYRTLITWVTDLANRMVERYPDSSDPLGEPAIVLVDEIDLHLHPVWQRKLMGFLTERFPNTQFIATAHSPLVAQAAADANLAVLRRDGDHVVIDNDLENIRGWRIDQILTSELFGLESARPPQIEGLLADRKALLTKPVLTDADRRRLEEIAGRIGELPTGETAQELKERKEIRKTLDLLTQGARPAP